MEGSGALHMVALSPPKFYLKFSRGGPTSLTGGRMPLPTPPPPKKNLQWFNDSQQSAWKTM